MKWIRHIGLLIFTSIVFIGTVGIRSYSYYCNNKSEKASCYSNGKSSCCADKKEVQDVEGCCKKEIKIYQAKFDAFHTYEIEIPDFIFETTSIHFHFFKPDYKNDIYLNVFNRPPPDKPSGKEIGIVNQVFRI